MSYNGKKFLDINGLKHLISILDDYPTNEVLGTVINAIESEIPTNVSQLQNDAGYLTAHQDISGKANSADLAAVATSGDYDDLINKPTIPAVPVQDVQVNGTSILSQGVANVPVGSNSSLGVVKGSNIYGVSIWGGGTAGQLATIPATDAQIKAGNQQYAPVTPTTQHLSTFYGLAKAAGDSTQSASSNTVGNYTDNAKQSIQRMLGITDLLSTEETTTATAPHAINSTFMMNGKLHRATAAIAIGDAVEVGTNCEVVKADEVFVKNTDYASNSTYGIVKSDYSHGITSVNGILEIYPASINNIKTSNDEFRPITANYAKYAAFYGLAKAAGDTSQASSDNAVGTYTETAKTAIRNMLGAASPDVIAVQDTQPTNTDTKVWLPETQATGVQVPTMEDMNTALAGKVSDVQVNGISVVTNGVANVPIASTTALGVVKIPGISYGITMNANGVIFPGTAVSTEVKAGTQEYKQLTPAVQHEATFYGLAKAAGDSTQSSSSNSVGTYTNEAKAAIKAMLGITDGLSDPVEVSGATPTITATKDTRYVCGEVSILTVTPPASGICIVRFTSGSTPTVLTATDVVWPEWFDVNNLEANTIYEICITDGVYGAVMTWPQTS